jgi:uracil-DNA glycosylase
VEDVDTLLTDVRACRACEDVLPLGARPVLQLSSTARILIASRAPGTKIHESGIPFADASGDRLREWMRVPDNIFYDERRIAILPMGLCYPGRARGSGDAPPRPECAPLWRDRLLALTRDVRLTLLVGTHAQTATLGPGNLTERVRAFRDHMPADLPATASIVAQPSLGAEFMVRGRRATHFAQRGSACARMTTADARLHGSTVR